MQNLFALQQCTEATYELCRENISEAFSPNLNSMEVQDKSLLEEQKKIALKLFENAFAKGEREVEHADTKIEKEVNKAFKYYATQVSRDTDYFRKNLVSDVEKIYDYYIGTLSLVVAFAELAEADKKVSHKNFVNNAWIKGLRSSEELKKESLRLGRHWQDKADLVRQWFRDVVRQETEYLDHLDRKNPSYED